MTLLTRTSKASPAFVLPSLMPMTILAFGRRQARTHELLSADKRGAFHGIFGPGHRSPAIFFDQVAPLVSSRPFLARRAARSHQDHSRSGEHNLSLPAARWLQQLRPLPFFLQSRRLPNHPRQSRSPRWQRCRPRRTRTKSPWMAGNSPSVFQGSRYSPSSSPCRPLAKQEMLAYVSTQTTHLRARKGSEST